MSSNNKQITTQLCDKVCSQKRWMFLVTFLFTAILGIAGYTVWRECFKHRSKTEILHTFGKVFYTEAQIEEFRASENIGRVVTNRNEKYKKVCSFSCSRLSSEPTTTPHHQSQNYYHFYNAEQNRKNDENYYNDNAGDVIGKSQNDENIERGSTDHDGLLMKLIRRRNNDTEKDVETTNNTSSNNVTSTINSGNNATDDNNNNNNNNNTNINNNNNNTDDVYEDEDVEPKLGRVLRTGTERIHGCCVSRTIVVVPNRLRTLDGRSVRVVQFDDRRQVYKQDQCMPLSDCTGCTCVQESRTFRAVVVDGDDNDNNDGGDNHSNDDDNTSWEGFRLEDVVVPGCCKCLNNV